MFKRKNVPQEIVERCANLERRCAELEAELADLVDLSSVTRVGVSWPHTSRDPAWDGCYREWWGVEAQFSLQDDGRTLKIFLEPRNA